MKLPIENSETLSEKTKVEKTFSPSHNMTEYVISYWKWESYSGNKSLVGTWIVIGEGGLGHLLRNAYERESNHQGKGPNFSQSKTDKYTSKIDSQRLGTDFQTLATNERAF